MQKAEQTEVEMLKTTTFSPREMGRPGDTLTDTFPGNYAGHHTAA